MFYISMYIRNPGRGYSLTWAIWVCTALKSMVFLAVSVINRVLILAILVSNRVWALQSSLELGMFIRRSYFFIIIDETINKTLRN